MTDFTVVQAYVALMRPYNSLALWLSFIIGATLADGADVQSLICGLIILTLLHSAANIHNDLVDMNVDRENKRQSGLLSGLLDSVVAWNLTRWLIIASLLVALIPDQRVIHVGFVVLFGVLFWHYNSPRVRLSYRPVMSIVVLGLCYSAIPLLYGYIISVSSFEPWVAMLAFFWFMQRASISIMKDYKDAYGDKKQGKNTFYLRFGRRTTIVSSVFLGVLGYIGATGILISFTDGPMLVGVVFMAAMSATLVYRFRQIGLTDERKLSILFNKSFASHNFVEAAVIAWLIL